MKIWPHALLGSVCGVVLIQGTLQAAFFSDRQAWEQAVGKFALLNAADPNYSVCTSGTKLEIGAGLQLTFSSDLMCLKVGDGWDTWAKDSFPMVMWTQGLPSLSGQFSGGLVGFGFELEPADKEEHEFEFSVGDQSSLKQKVHGNAGAKFFGWFGSPIHSFSISGDTDFAIGNVASLATKTPDPGRDPKSDHVPDQGITLLLAAGVFSLLGLVRRSGSN